MMKMIRKQPMHKRLPMQMPDDSMLMAYADGELNAGACEQVEAWIAQVPAMQTRVESFMRSRALLQAALAAPLHEPARQQSAALIGALGAMIANERSEKVVPLHARRSFSPVIGYAVAASLAAIMVGFGGGLAWQSSVDHAARLAALDAANAAALNQVVALALETSPNDKAVMINTVAGTRQSITPLQTFLTDDGQICREYLLAGAKEEVATACRDDNGRWLPRTVTGRRT
jgi:anti-sigma factor RsiW